MKPIILDRKTGYPAIVWRRCWIAGRGWYGKYQLVWKSYNSTRVRKILCNYDANNKSKALKDKENINIGIGFGNYIVK